MRWVNGAARKHEAAWAALAAVARAVQLRGAGGALWGVASEALWFFGGGLLMLLAAALNALKRAYGHVAPGVRWVCVGANVAITGFAVASGLVEHATAGQWAVVLGILVPLLALSLSERVLRAPTGSGAA